MGKLNKFFKKISKSKDGLTVAQAAETTATSGETDRAAGESTAHVQQCGEASVSIGTPNLSSDAEVAFSTPQADTQEPEPDEPSSWHRAYNELREEDEDLVKNYEKLLKIQSGLDGSSDMVENGDSREQCEQMIALAESMAAQKEGKQTKYTIFGHKFVLQNQVKDAANLILQVKGFVGEATKSSPEASLAWAGVSLFIPLLTNHSVATEANKTGFTYVNSRVRFYQELEHLLLQGDYSSHPGLKRSMQDALVQLFKHVLGFQLESVGRFTASRFATVKDDVVHKSKWTDKFAEIKLEEQQIEHTLLGVSSLASRNNLDSIRKDANRQVEILDDLLGVATQQLAVAEESLEVDKRILEMSKEKFNVAKQMDHSLKIISQNLTIEPLIVYAARYDSRLVDQQNKCFPKTRTEILSRIKSWADDASQKPVFWLTGPAGTGKSTIAQSLLEGFDRQNRLAASYYFKRGEDDQNGAMKFFPTIASQLREKVPFFASHLNEACRDVTTETLRTMSLDKQFDTLISGPLRNSADNSSNYQLARVILIDALDECEDRDKVHALLESLGTLPEVSAFPLRIICTSRNTQRLESVFSKIGKHDTLILHTFNPHKAGRDIRIYLKNTLAQIYQDWTDKQEEESWPSDDDLARLVELATDPDPLFIYASTLCLFVSENRRGRNPVGQLRKWLNEPSHGLLQMDRLYRPVLEEAFTMGAEPYLPGEYEEECSTGRQVLASIVLLATPLSASALASLLGMEERVVTGWLRNLQAVLDVPQSPKSRVRILHQSFSDWLLRDLAGAPGEKEDKFHIDYGKGNAELALRCIKRMSADIIGLKKDICHLKEPGKLAGEVEKTIRRSIPRDLRYACVNWVYHLVRGGKYLIDAVKVDTFIRKYFLFWLEALSILRRIPEGVTAVSELLEIYESEKPEEKQLIELLYDARRFILTHNVVIEMAPLQVYISALIFSPSESLIKQLFQAHEEQCDGKLVLPVKKYWDKCLMTLEGHRRYVNSVVFSHDSRLIASASDDGTIRIWNILEAQCAEVLDGRIKQNSVAFSHNSSTIAAAGNDGKIRCWDVATGQRKWTLTGHTAAAVSISFSHDSALLASASSDKTIRIWDADGNQQGIIQLDSELTFVVFSHNSSLLAGSSLNNTVKIFSTDTWEAGIELIGHNRTVNSVAFSHDSKLLVSASEDGTARIWDLHAGGSQVLQHGSRVQTAAFSHDSTFVACGGWRSVFIWDINSKECVYKLEKHTLSVNSVAFSRDDVLLASASSDWTICVWDLKKGRPGRQFTQLHYGLVGGVAISIDGALAASSWRGPSVAIWDPRTGLCSQIIKDDDYRLQRIALSKDGRLLATDCISIRMVQHEAPVYFAEHDAIAIWKVETAERKLLLKGHDEEIKTMCFSDDSALLASVSEDAIAKIWNLDSGTCLYTIPDVDNCTTISSFEAGNMFLHTNCGTLALRKDAAAWSLVAQSQGMHKPSAQVYSVRDRRWVHFNDERVMRLPVEFEAVCWAASDTMLVVGCYSGTVVFLQLPRGGVRPLGEH